jgi:ATP-dependent DNA helicase DinG
VGFVAEVDRRSAPWRAQEDGGRVADAVCNYKTYLTEYGTGCYSVFEPKGVAVSYIGRNGADAVLRQDVVGLGEPLKELIWNRIPSASISATLALDESFDYYRRSTGAMPDFEEILPTPFDYPRQAAVYIPKVGQVPDPTIARRDGSEARYYQALARELSQIIRLMEGRTLALFHSRKEMDAVYGLLNLPPDLPVYTQQRTGAGASGERFIENERASLLALRSFWTGFDAPGPTLSCVVLVRIPFEVPVDPPAVARLAYLQTLGIDAFRDHTLPQAKMLMRQGAGRLIRHAEDTGVIAILDPRIRTKPYGEEFLANLPPGMREYDDFIDAAGWVLGQMG